MKRSNNVYCLCEGALMVAAAQILGMIKLWKMPWGGSATLAMVPIVLFSIRWGLVKGLISGLLLGVLQILLDGASAISIQSVFGDYLLAYMAIGLAGLAKGNKNAWLLGTLAGGGVRFLVHYVVGATVWAMYMPDDFLGMTMTSPWFYSFLYNLCYMVPNIIFTAVALFLLKKPMRRYFNREDLKTRGIL